MSARVGVVGCGIIAKAYVEGSIAFDRSKPDGMPRKLLDVSRIAALGWQPRISLREGLESTFRWALRNRVFDSETAPVRGITESTPSMS